ncbi:MAG: hypothetical protein HOY71_15330 [Nonomuraea sp.]|nr:hypothetical protein [Nonomuraea sp.]
MKQRVQLLEASGRDSGATTGPGDLSEAADAIAGLHREISEELTALGVEIAGLRWQTVKDHTSCQSELLERLDSLQLGMHHLVFRLDQLLDKGLA